MSEKTIPQKLLLKPGRTMAIVNGPETVMPQFVVLPDFARMVEEIELADVVLVFIKNFTEFNAFFRPLTKRLKAETIFWVAFPKKSGTISTDLDRDKLHVYAATLGWQGVSLVAIDEDWSAMRFKSK
jgi:hypothetical protein